MSELSSWVWGSEAADTTITVCVNIYIMSTELKADTQTYS